MEIRSVLEMVESARESSHGGGSFARGLFMGQPDFYTVFPFPEQPEEDRKAGDAILEQLRSFLAASVDADEIDRSGEIPMEVVDGLKEMGLFGIMIPEEYGGLGLSHLNYNRIIHLVASHCASTAVMLSAHQSIGVPQPLIQFGSEEQKQKYLPRIASGAVSAFALTEPGVGSDPSSMATEAIPVEDGKAYLVNGEKLWISNGPVAELMILMARTPSDNPSYPAISAFIVEGNSLGITSQRCSFMGLKGLSNGVLRFKDVKIPAENLLWEEGKGLKIALTTLNTGRLTIPAAASATARQCVAILRPWINDRKQWGGSIGTHEAVAAKIAEIAAFTYAIDSVSTLTSTLSDDEDLDLRIEAAMAKLYSSEVLWNIVDETLQVRGGRGYETADSLVARGEEGPPVERMMRDARINLIIEGTSNIMRLFIAREALEPHIAAVGLDRRPSLSKLAAAARFYTLWYPGLYIPKRVIKNGDLPQPLVKHAVFVEKQSRRLARTIFHSMVRYQRGLQDRQRKLGRIIDIGTGLFAMAAVLSRAAADSKADGAMAGVLDLADLFCTLHRRRIKTSFRELRKNSDAKEYKIAQDFMEGRFSWLEESILSAWKSGSD